MSQTTKRALEASLKHLLAKKPLDKITINDIAEDCGISRMTFYYHFKDIYDLIEWSCVEEASRVFEGNKTYDTWQEGFLAVFYLAKEDKTFIENIYRSVSLELLEQYLYRLVYPLLKNVVDEKAKNYTVRDENKKYIADFYKYGYSVIVYFHLAGVVMPQNAAAERLKHLAYRNHGSSVDYHGIHRQR